MRVEMRSITKSFGGVRALSGVDFLLAEGEIRALVGENGAGKSTLMKVLSGAVPMDSGEIAIDGRPARIASPHDSRALGVGIIYQEFALAPDLSVAENIFISRLPAQRFIRWQRLYAEAGALLAQLGFDIDPRAEVRSLSVAQQQVVEIAKALSEEVKVLILDEPSAVLAPHEIEKLFGILRLLKERGVSIVYISHRMEEIFQIADTITVMKDGALSGFFKAAEVNRRQLIAAMIGRELTAMFPERRVTQGEEVLRVAGLTNARIHDISFSVRRGEVLGIAGLVGSGRTEIARAIYGADSLSAGTISIKGREVAIRSPCEAVANGLAFVPEDRKNQGALLALSIKQNITLPSLRRITCLCGFLQKKKERALVAELIERLTIKTGQMENPVSSLSGGNQQKVVLAKWFSDTFEVMLLDEPTRGVDVGAKYEIYALINKIAAQGLGVLVISSEMVELIGICDRILVVKGGRLQGELVGSAMSEEGIMRLAI
jgi:ribose transport system ATP-binding protein